MKNIVLVFLGVYVTLLDPAVHSSTRQHQNVGVHSYVIMYNTINRRTAIRAALGADIITGREEDGRAM